jgi:hypothetical protein
VLFEDICPFNEVTQMELPANSNLPYLSYGLFKPNEPAYNKISQFVEEAPIRIRIKGSLYIRDGLPLFTLRESKIVNGYLIKFRNNFSLKSYRIISYFEPKEQYEWGRYNLSDDNFANILIGISPEIASVHFEGREWNSFNDPMFNECLKVIGDVVEKSAVDKFASAHPGCFDWERLFKLQMGYLLLWTAIERFCSLNYGPTLNPEAKTKKLGEDNDFSVALTEIVTRKAVIYNCQDPNKHYELISSNPLESIKYYRQVRHNLSHRGKATWRDGEIIRLSLIELLDIFKSLLKKKYTCLP